MGQSKNMEATSLKCPFLYECACAENQLNKAPITHKIWRMLPNQCSLRKLIKLVFWLANINNKRAEVPNKRQLLDSENFSKNRLKPSSMFSLKIGCFIELHLTSNDFIGLESSILLPMSRSFYTLHSFNKLPKILLSKAI